MTDRHISDDRLIDLCMTSPAAAVEHAHLTACLRCEARRVEIVGILEELDEAATLEAATVFPEAKLERQHARILQRVDRDGRPGRLVPFPPHEPPTTFLSPTRPRVRWAAAVAAAAFVAGVLTGQWTHNFSSGTARTPAFVVANEPEFQPLRAVPTTFSEEEFLGQIEVAGSRNGPVALRPLDAMTPRAWEVR
jgi:hypothetical protein